jgi:hypothetical protein
MTLFLVFPLVSQASIAFAGTATTAEYKTILTRELRARLEIGDERSFSALLCSLAHTPDRRVCRCKEHAHITQIDRFWSMDLIDPMQKEDQQ